jgi:hypothetical protein
MVRNITEKRFYVRRMKTCGGNQYTNRLDTVLNKVSEGIGKGYLMCVVDTESNKVFEFDGEKDEIRVKKHAGKRFIPRRSRAI